VKKIGSFVDSRAATLLVRLMAPVMESPWRYRFFDPVTIPEGAGIRSGEEVLEIGCGTGFFTVPAAELVGNKGRVYAVDPHPLGWAFFSFVLAQTISVLGWGDWFPWSVPVLLSGMYGPQCAEQIGMHTYILVLVAFIAGMAATFASWQSTDQVRCWSKSFQSMKLRTTRCGSSCRFQKCHYPLGGASEARTERKDHESHLYHR
jgi:hypothetical protein